MFLSSPSAKSFPSFIAYLRGFKSVVTKNGTYLELMSLLEFIELIQSHSQKFLRVILFYCPLSDKGRLQ